jgi:hypothetical protein
LRAPAYNVFDLSGKEVKREDVEAGSGLFAVPAVRNSQPVAVLASTRQ